MATASDTLPTIFGTDAAPKSTLSRWVSDGRVRRLASGIYTNDLATPLEDLVRNHLWEIVARVAPDAVVADRTALEGGPAADGSVFVISARRRAAELPGIVIRPRAGHPALTDIEAAPSDMPLPGGIHMTSRARALLENLRGGRSGSATRTPRTFSRAELETLIERTLRTSGEVAVNRLRDEARSLAPILGLERELDLLDEMVGALQGTRSANLRTAQGAARMRGTGFDPDRLSLFSALHEHLRSLAPVSRPAPPHATARLQHLPFFEAYFSNFIEGTEFSVDEAADIVYEGRVPTGRPQDAHDVSGTWAIVNDIDEMSRLPLDADHLIELLKARHATLLAGRPDKRPGEFKVVDNRAGGTHFVRPELVAGTLQAAFELYPSLETAFERACYLMFVVAEVHPFDDGNGRMARVFMNAEFVAAGEWRIIVPTVYRNNYLQALRALTHNALTAPLPRMLDFAQRYTAAIEYGSVNRTALLLDRTHAFLDANEADAQGIRLQIPTAEDHDAVAREVEPAASGPIGVWNEAVVAAGSWLPKHREFTLQIGDGIELHASTKPAFGDQTWMLIRDERMSVTCTGIPLAQAAPYRQLLERVYQAFEQDGDAQVVGRRFPIAAPAR
jgi:fido (protein-threonine AMPylation protein)